jgi:hypothetical protein
MVPSESAPQELSNEWSCREVSTIINVLGNFCVRTLGDRSHHQSLKDYWWWWILSTNKMWYTSFFLTQGQNWKKYEYQWVIAVTITLQGRTSWSHQIYQRSLHLILRRVGCQCLLEETWKHKKTWHRWEWSPKKRFLKQRHINFGRLKSVQNYNAYF